MAQYENLYKYTKLEHIRSTLKYGIFASRVDSLNDPYENRNITNKEEYRVVCLSRSANQKLMWSHYANGHRGCSIKIKPPDDYGIHTGVLRRVNYTSKMSMRPSKDEEIKNSLYDKDKKWKNELEVRAVMRVADCDEKWEKQGEDYYYKAYITHVYFGCFSHLDSNYLEALETIREYNANHRRQIIVRKYKMSDKRYQFILDKEFDYRKEIEKFQKNKNKNRSILNILNEKERR